jgi:hypothetical protein
VTETIKEIDMARETKTAMHARVGALLADFDARNREINKLKKIADGLKEQIKEIDPGTYGDWVLAKGTPREVLDQRAARELLTQHGVEVPMKLTDAPIVVTAKA